MRPAATSVRSPAARTALALLALLASPAPAAGQGAVGDGVAAMEARADAWADAARARVAELPVLGELSRRVRVSGSAEGIYLDAQRDSQLPDEHWMVWDARAFVDVLLGENLSLAGRPLLRAAGISLEWEFYRLGRRTGDLGELTLDLQGLLGSGWANLSLGRFQLPVGEGYLRYSRGAKDNPFVTNAVSSPWWWDEGVKLWGASGSGRFGYVASFTEGTTPRDWNFDRIEMMSLKLFANPRPWLHVSLSALRSGHTGGGDDPASAALWLGEAWARAFGDGSPVPNLVDGRPVPDGPPTLASTFYVGGDVVLEHPAGARLWLSYGSYDVDSTGPGLYDRRLHGWNAELVLEGSLASPELRPFYVAMRASGLGTYRDDEGYLLDVRYAGRLGYDMRSLETYSLGLGWHLTRWTDLKLEYTFQDVDVVEGAGARGIRADRADFLAVSLGIHF